MNSPLPQTFRELESTLAELALPASTELDAARERLERDLLPRTAGASEFLVAGIVGPNNIGKSLLFNSLVGTPLSPSEPRGGATRRLVGAAGPELFAALTSEPTLAQFPLVPVETAGAPLEAAKQNADDPRALLFVEVAGLTPGLMLIDTPDFDSVFVENRAATESLLRVADLALVVVNRQTYANALVVDFLKSWLEHGRPWALVYNEAFADHDITREHVAEMTAQIGAQPLAVFVAPFDIELQAANATKPLVPRQLGPSSAEAPSAPLGLELGAWLAGEEQTAIKRAALAASIKELKRDLGALVARLTSEAELAARLWQSTLRETTRVAEATAAGAMPPDSYLEAFRRVADQRIPAWRRGMRASQRKLRLAVEGLTVRLLGGKPAGVEPVQVAVLEARELRNEWAPLVERVGRRLEPGSDVWSGAEAGEWPTRISRALKAAMELGPPTPDELGADARTLATFEAHCEALITAEFEAASSKAGRRAAEHAVQLGVDMLQLLPMAAGVGTAIATGGVGADVASVAAGGLGASLMERFTKHLGSGFARRARARWQDLRGAALGEALARRLFGALAAELEARATRHTAQAQRLQNLLDTLP